MYRRGQTESSFQWVFVLIAGIALLGFFLMLVRNCAKQGDEQLQGGNFAQTAQLLRSVAWRGESEQNTSLPVATVVCPAGTLSLSTQNGATSLDRAPVFLPPQIGGRAQLATREIILGSNTPAPIPLGSVLYVLDEKTQYFFLQDADGLADRLNQNLPYSALRTPFAISRVTDPVAVAAKIPTSLSTVVFVAVGNEIDLRTIDVSQIPSTVRVRGVALNPSSTHGGTAQFYERSGDRLVKIGEAVSYAHELVGLGFVIAADRENALCAQDAVASRMRFITTTLELRAKSLNEELVDSTCKAGFSRAHTILVSMNKPQESDEYLSAVFDAETSLIGIQSALLRGRSICPEVG